MDFRAKCNADWEKKENVFDVRHEAGLVKELINHFKKVQGTSASQKITKSSLNMHLCCFDDGIPGNDFYYINTPGVMN
jgi:hypothetical protein